jgi:hypothetical protein|nr:MAG TPA: hypothetical protein [Caudoviricetes sp.]
METIKVSVDVNINFSESIKTFLSGLFGQQPKCNTEVTKVEQPKPAAKPVPTQSAQSAKTQELAKPAASVPAAHATSTPASSAIKIDQVRKALAEKVNDHRAAIKAKLEELGAPSVTKLDPAKYEEMYNFLTQL